MHPNDKHSANISDFNITDFDQFIAYLNDQLSDNGKGDLPYFMPLARANSVVTEQKAATFYRGLSTPYNQAGWRKMWLCHGDAGQIIGHIDLRAHSEPTSITRCLLGMGVQRDFRHIGLGKVLLAHAESWLLKNTSINWIDLQVLSGNLPAIRLYQSSNFVITEEKSDVFQLDGHEFSEINMSKKIR